MEPLGSIAVSAAQGALNIVLAKAVDEIKLTWEFKDDLDNLKDRLKTLQAFLVDAGTKKSLNILEKLWIEKVEKVATRANGLFDEFSSENGRRQVELEIEDRYYHKGSPLNARYWFYFSLSNPLGFRWRMAHQVKGVNSMINNVFKEAHELGIRARDLAPAISDYQYKEVVDTRQVVGRDCDEAYLVEQLCPAGSTSTGDVSFVAIVGIPGIGKSTLARRVYENEKVIKFFAERIWIYVSDDFNINTILSLMVEFLAESKPKLSNIEVLTKKLSRHMGGKKYLLVLDDVNTVEGRPWEALKTCLHRIGGSSGSQVLVTTRSNAVANSVKARVVHTLKGLADVDSWTLFKQTVFTNGEACPSNLEKNARKIVDKCNGVPLAIKTLGATLNLQDLAIKTPGETLNLQDWKSAEKIVDKSEYEFYGPTSLGLLGSIAVDAAKGTLNIVLATAVDEIKLTWGFRGDLDKLKERLTMLQAILVEAGTMKSLTNPEQLWVEKLNKVARHAEDLFDEFSFENLRRKLEIKDRYCNRGSRLKARYLFFFCLSNPLGFWRRMAHQVKNVTSMIDGLFREARDLGIKPTKLAATGSDGSLGSVADGELHQYMEVVDIRQVVGRDYDEKYLVEQLCGADSTEVLSFVAIVGIPGIGKTTLAKRIYENEAVIKSFTKRIWIYVSDDFNINRILSQMIEVLATSKADLSSTEALIQKLQDNMGGAKYLLVLYDAWNTVEELWESLKMCLHRIGGSSGSKVLVTTRSNAVADSVKVRITHHLEGLPHEDSWALFKQTAFANDEICPSNLEESGRKIVGKCNGVPLAIKTLGATLRLKRNLQDWKSIENSELWKLQDYGDRIMPYLLLSFHHLPSPNLKQCFAYCSIYEKGAEISKEELIELWMAQGLLFLEEGRNLKMEEIGESYFNILLNHSFLQLPERNELGDIFTCKMHDLVHDFARFVSRRDWLICESGGSLDDESSSISHLMISSGMTDQVTTPSMMKIMQNGLRTIQSFVAISNDLLMQARYVRVLQLSGIGLTNVPDVIGELKHLRYLDLSRNPFKELPESITTLYKLQTLKLITCGQLDRLPTGLSKLVNLRHLHIDKLMKVSAGIERLTCLQTLPGLELSASDGEWKLHELGCLRDVKGSLQIGGLEHAKCKEEAQKAEIGAKPVISFLHLRWSSRERDEGGSIALEVLDGLEPHPNLQRLQVEGFNGDSFPGWLRRMRVVNNIETGQLASLDKLVVMELIDCRRCSHLPTLGQLPVLKTLVIDGMKEVKQIGPELYTQSEGNDVQPESSSGMTSTGNRNALFPALTRLEIKNCPNLGQWLPPESTNPPVESFPCLEKLKIVGCPLLTITPTGFPSLRHLELREIKSAQRLLHECGKSSKLTSLILDGVEELSHLPKELCEQFTSLETLEIRRCNKLACLPEDLGKLTSLKMLKVWQCPVPKLKSIVIENCPILAEGCAKDVGPEWHTISHIKYIEVDGQTIQNLP